MRKLSEIIVEMAQLGLKEAYRKREPYPAVVNLLAVLATEAWNYAVLADLGQSLPSLAHRVNTVLAETPAELRSENAKLVSTDWLALAELMVAYKRLHYPGDYRQIVACEATPQETLRVHWH